MILAPVLFPQRHLVDAEFLVVEGVVYLVGGAFLGLLLLSLNTPIIKLYENGFFVSPWLKRRNKERHERRYVALNARRAAYRQAAETEQDLEEATGRLEMVHEKLEKLESQQQLPHDIDYVMPTALGNAFAKIEEYPYERYGMDAIVYWPRLVAVIPEDYQSQLANLKATLDFFLNLSLLAGLFGLGALAIGVWFRIIPVFVYGLLALVVAYGVYRLAVASTRDLGELTMSCFDLFRGALLENLLGKYDVHEPVNLIAEQQLWQSLASFIRRGEGFYFPHNQATEDRHTPLQR